MEWMTINSYRSRFCSSVTFLRVYSSFHYCISFSIFLYFVAVIFITFLLLSFRFIRFCSFVWLYSVPLSLYSAPRASALAVVCSSYSMFLYFHCCYCLLCYCWYFYILPTFLPCYRLSFRWRFCPSWCTIIIPVTLLLFLTPSSILLFL